MRRSLAIALLTILTVIEAQAQELGAEPIDSEVRTGPLEQTQEASAAAAVAAVPMGFFTEEIAPGYSFNQPVGVTFAPDGRIFVTEKRGRIYIVENGVKLATPFIDIDSEVLNHWDRGLLGFQLDPDFETNGRVYLLYTFDRDGSGDYQRQDVASRLTRYTVSAGDPNQVDLSTRKVLIGETFPEAIPSCFYSHTIGTLQFGSDGTLLVGAGDGADFNVTDPGGLHPSCFGSGLFPASEDIGAFRSQRLQSLAGKILRIDPETGYGLPSNPFYTGEPTDNASRVWVLGLRNPYRFTLRKDGSTDPVDGQPGTLFIGDVGWGTWEDLHTSFFGGENFGWPCYEGPLPHSSYQSQTPAATYCTTPPFVHSAPTSYWHHSNTSLSSPSGLAANAIVVGDLYRGYRYPAGYADKLFYADYTRGWISTANVSASNILSGHSPFGSGLGAVVDIRFDEVSSYMYWVNISANQVYRLRHDDENAPPNAIASATPIEGYAPLDVDFTGGSSFDPDGDPISFFWDFGDGGTSTLPNPTYRFEDGGVYQVSLTVTDDGNASDQAFLQIAVDNTYPTAHIVSPADGASFDNTESVNLVATGSDAEDAPSALTYDWLVVQRHNTHSHSDFFADEGEDVSFDLEQHGVPEEVSYLQIRLIVTDTGGLTDTVYHYIEVRRPGEIDITGSGTPVALVTTPTGSGNPDIGVIADSNLPDTSSVDPMLHYDTFDGSPKSLDWIGYTFASERNFSKLILQQGVQTPSGGWFDSLSVEVRTDGVWEPVNYLSPIPLYENQNGLNFDKYTLLFEARWGDGIRVIGKPGGSDHYVSVGELRVFGLTTPEFTSDVRSGGSTLTVQFSDASTIPNPTAWQWNFGDGSTGFGMNPEHTYVLEGSYDVTLTVQSLTGYYTEHKQDYIVVGQPGIFGEYYDEEVFTGTRMTRIDPSINFIWANGSPDPSMGADEFSVRWSGWLLPEYTENYTFFTTTDDGVRLWVGDELVIDQWVLQSPTEWSGSLPLQAGELYPVRMEFYEHQGGATAQLEWQSLSRTRQIIPSSRMIAASVVPGISRFDPAYGDYGTRVTVFGQKLAGATAVQFNGVPSTTFGVVSDKELWADVPSGATSGDITVTTPNGSGIAGVFFVNDSVLGLELDRFTVVANGSEARVRWHASNASEVEYFVVERKRSEEDSYQTVGGATVYDSSADYEITVDVESVGRYLFRLMIVGRDGNSSYSDEIELNAVLSAEYEVDAPYPNPFERQVTVGVAVREQQRVTVALYDMLGRKQIVAFDDAVEANQHELITVSGLDRLASGVYVLRVSGSSFTSDHRVVRVR